jgi:GNAT superfamily N-acetyltransferase
MMHQVTLRMPNGSVVARFRPAAPADIPAIEQLISLSARGLSQGDYSDEQIDAALGSALGVDSQLISDRTYYVAEAAGALIACGGWSWRKTLFGSDQGDRQPEPLDPASEAARIRAFFVHPDWARQGLGRALLELCEGEARAAGFKQAELMATLPGERLYRNSGYWSRPAIEHVLRDGVTIRFVPMVKVL